MTKEDAQEEEDVHREPQTEIISTAKLEAQPKVEQPVEEGRKAKRPRSVNHNEEAELEEKKAFVSAKAHSLWNKQFADKGFIRKRGFGKIISPFFRNNRKERLGILL